MPSDELITVTLDPAYEALLGTLADREGLTREELVARIVAQGLQAFAEDAIDMDPPMALGSSV